MTNVYTAAPDSLEEIQTQKRVEKVHIDGLVRNVITPTASAMKFPSDNHIPLLMINFNI